MEDTQTVERWTFDPTKVDIHHPNINAVYQRVIVEGEAVNTIFVNWVHNYQVSRDDSSNVRPEWADLPIDERKFMVIPDTLANVITRQHLANPNRFVHELPCPPYQFDMDDGKLRIKAGPFEKHGSKSEWTQVIEQMEAEVEDMPDAIDVSELPDITVSLEVKVSTTYDLSVEQLIGDHEMYEDGQWMGDESELEDALTYAIDDYDFDTGDIDMSYADWDEIEVSNTDLDYCMRQVSV